MRELNEKNTRQPLLRHWMHLIKLSIDYKRILKELLFKY